jgi:hypothetical protein
LFNLKSAATASANARKAISGGQKKKSNGPRPELTEEQKQEILTLRNGTEWRDVLIGKKKKVSGTQGSMANDILTEHNEREIREKRLVLFGVTASTATSNEVRG